MNAFCTIITSGYLHYALALRESILQFGDIELYILVSDNVEPQKESIESKYSGIKVISFDLVCTQGWGETIFEKYYHESNDTFRWSMKPVFMDYLVKLGYEKIIYVDCDIHFFSSWKFLFDYLDNFNILLSPHNRSLFPTNDPDNFQKNFSEGIYNGGFIGINKYAGEFLSWFSQACAYNCSKTLSKGFYDDQKYLDLVPARFEKVLCIQHKGCNVSEWNMIDCKRELIDGEVLINGRYPIVFIHFVEYTSIRIFNGQDSLLMPFFNIYQSRLKNYNEYCDITPEIKSNSGKNRHNKSTPALRTIKNLITKFFKYL